MSLHLKAKECEKGACLKIVEVDICHAARVLHHAVDSRRTGSVGNDLIAYHQLAIVNVHCAEIALHQEQRREGLVAERIALEDPAYSLQVEYKTAFLQKAPTISDQERPSKRRPQTCPPRCPS